MSGRSGRGSGAVAGRYRKSLGLIELVSLGIGGTIGSGIFVVPGVAAGIAGPWSLLAWAIVAVSACCVAFSLAALQGRSPAGMRFAGLFEPVFGRRAATALAGLYLVSSVLGIATIAAGLGQYLAFFAMSHILAVELCVLAAFLGINLIGIRLSGRTENVLTAIKVACIVAIALALAPFVRVENLIPERAASLPDMMKAAIIVYWSFTGFEISAIPVEETTDPRRIPLALAIVMLVVCGVYLTLNVGLIGVAGSKELAASTAPVAYAAGRVFAGAAPFVAAIGIITMLSALNAYIVAASRVLQNVAEASCLPFFAKLSARGAPAAALAASCLVSSVLLFISNHFDRLATASVVTNLVPYVAICAAAFVSLQRRQYRVVAFAGAVITTAILVLYLLL